MAVSKGFPEEGTSELTLRAQVKRKQVGLGMVELEKLCLKKQEFSDPDQTVRQNPMHSFHPKKPQNRNLPTS